MGGALSHLPLLAPLSFRTLKGAVAFAARPQLVIVNGTARSGHACRAKRNAKGWLRVSALSHRSAQEGPHCALPSRRREPEQIGFVVCARGTSCPRLLAERL